jgi:hypothetical protein
MSNQNQKIPISKLVILYLLNSLDLQLSEHQIVKCITNNNWGNYFDIKESLFELSEIDMLKKRETPNGVFYTITDIGKSSIEIFSKDILHSVRENIDSYSKNNRDSLQKESDLFADYIKLKDNEFRVTLRILEDTSSIFEINLVVYSKGEAETIINNWLKSASNIYKYTYTELMNE